MKQIPLSKCLFTLVSDEDYEYLARFRWWTHSVPKARTWYATTRIDNQRVLMHRFLLGTAPDLDVDHINGNGLDNRRENLREVSTALNAQNAQLSRANTTGVKGISVCYITGKYRATVNYLGKQYSAGRFTTLDAAEEAVRNLRTKLHKNARHG